MLDKIELSIKLNFNKNIIENYNNNIHVWPQLEEQIQKQKLKDSGLRLDDIISMIVFFYRTTQTNGPSWVNLPLRSSAILDIQNDDKYCFIRSFSASLHPIVDSKNVHPTRVSNYRQNFNEINIQGFDITNGFKCHDGHIFEKLNDLSINIFELNFYQDQNIWKHKSIPLLEVSKNISDRVIDILIYKFHYVLK